MVHSPHLLLASSLIPMYRPLQAVRICLFDLIAVILHMLKLPVPSLGMRNAVERKDPFKMGHFKLMLPLFDLYGAIFTITTFIK
jgi:hypothetical protein